MKKITAIIVSIFICYSVLGQKEKSKKIDNGHCLFDDQSYINSSPSENKKIALLLKSNNKEYTGNHVIYTNDEIGRDVYGNMIVKVGRVDFGIKRSKDSLCTLKQLLIVRKYQGGGIWGSPYLLSILQLPEVGTFQTITPSSIGLFSKEYKSCKCVEQTKNWLEGVTSSIEEGSSSNSNGVKRVKDVVPNAEVLNGPYEEKGGDGIVYKTGQYENGKKTGTWKYYGKGGKSAGMVEKEENYKVGELDGEVKTYSEDGSVKHSAEYKNGKLNGKTKHYEKGALVMEEQNVEGERNGKMIKYYNGKKEIETDFVNAKKNGVETKYYIENGKAKSITNYKDDRQDGPYKYFNKDGSLYEEGGFKDGYKEGEWKKYDSTGKVKEKMFYVKGEVEK